tara:strand:- start:83 stop:535 length:453 start_codon:yes stop_codon:yes gene_type:complete
MLNKLNYLIFTLFNIGKLPASGTIASIFTVFFYYFVASYYSKNLFIIILTVITIYSFIFFKKIINVFKSKDPKEIVIDEFIGQSIPLIICDKDLLLMIMSFLIFRFFDISKIFPANIFDKKLDGAIGVIGDDIVAGIYAFIIIYFIKIYI